MYALVGFLLIRLPKLFITSIYGKPVDACKDTNWINYGNCMIGDKELK
jgi:hypothetical protein